MSTAKRLSRERYFSPYDDQTWGKSSGNIAVGDDHNTTLLCQIRLAYMEMGIENYDYVIIIIDFDVNNNNNNNYYY